MLDNESRIIVRMILRALATGCFLTAGMGNRTRFLGFGLMFMQLSFIPTIAE